MDAYGNALITVTHRALLNRKATHEDESDHQLGGHGDGPSSVSRGGGGGGERKAAHMSSSNINDLGNDVGGGWGHSDRSSHSDSNVGGDFLSIRTDVRRLRISCCDVWREAMRMRFLWQTVNPLQAMAHATVFCCLDSEGVLSENEPSPEHVVFFDKDSQPEMLSLIHDPDSQNGMVFEGQWKQHIDSLKPIGLNALLTSQTCSARARQIAARSQEEFDDDDDENGKVCLCALSNEIGFNLEATRHQYFPVTLANVSGVLLQSDHHHQQHHVGVAAAVATRKKPKAIKAVELCMSSFVFRNVYRPRTGYQIMSKGDLHLVLAHCSEAWNGNALIPLTELRRNRLLEIFQQWHHLDEQCVAFSYVPVVPSARTNEIVRNVAEAGGIVSWLHNEAISATGSKPTLLPALSSPYDDDDDDHDATEANEAAATAAKTAAARFSDDDDNDDDDDDDDDEQALFVVSSEPCAPPPGVPAPLEPSSSFEQKRVTWASDLDDGAQQQQQQRQQLLDEELNNDDEASLVDEQIFVGMIAIRDQPKDEAVELVASVMNAGIRFVYFSPHDARKTMAFGTKIGLWTDFNVYITLRDPGANESIEQYQGPSKLPVGVSSVRDHLVEVDNVPLLVSLFADSDTASICEMLRIYQENGEVIFCMGSSLKPANALAFLQANVAASFNPTPRESCAFSGGVNMRHKQHNASSRSGSDDATKKNSSKHAYEQSFEFALSVALTSLPTALQFPACAKLTDFKVLIHQARGFVQNAKLAAWFACANFAALFCLMATSTMLDMPPLFTGYQLLWLIWLVIPALSLALLSQPYTHDIEKRLSAKNGVHLDTRCRYVVYFALRFLPSCAFIMVLFAMLLNAAVPDAHDWTREYYWRGVRASAADGVRWTGAARADLRETLAFIQHYCLFVWVYIMAWLSFSFTTRNFTPFGAVHRCLRCCFARCRRCCGRNACSRLDIRRASSPCRNGTWLAVCAACCLVQLLIFLCSVRFDVRSVPFVDAVPALWWSVPALAWPAVTLLVDDICKYHDFKFDNGNQVKSRFLFDCVLGMHSPK
jgi:hypothetical protein